MKSHDTNSTQAQIQPPTVLPRHMSSSYAPQVRRLAQAIREDAKAMAVIESPRFIRLPAPGKRDPLTGLSRGTLNELILACAANEFSPPVRSVLIKKHGASRGVRLIDVKSLISYLDRLGSGCGASTGVEISEEGGEA